MRLSPATTRASYAHSMPGAQTPQALVTGVDYVGLARRLQVQCPYCGEFDVHEWPRDSDHSDPGQYLAACGAGDYYIASPEPPPPPS